MGTKVSVFWPFAAQPHQSQSVKTSGDESSGKKCRLDLWNRKQNRNVCVCVRVCVNDARYSVVCTQTTTVYFHVCACPTVCVTGPHPLVSCSDPDQRGLTKRRHMISGTNLLADMF